MILFNMPFKKIHHFSVFHEGGELSLPNYSVRYYSHYSKYYPALNFRVTKGLNPIGKHKPGLRFRDVVVVYLNENEYINLYLQYINSDSLIKDNFNLAFFSHLNPNTKYLITVMGRKNNLNWTITFTNEPLFLDDLKKGGYRFFLWLKETFISHRLSEINKHRWRFVEHGFTRIIFKPAEEDSPEDDSFDSFDSSPDSPSFDNTVTFSYTSSPVTSPASNSPEIYPDIARIIQSDDHVKATRAIVTLKGPLYKDVPLPPSSGLDKSKTETDWKNSVYLFLPGDPLVALSPNIFRKYLRKGYKSHLHTVLQDNKIVSVLFKVKLISGNFRTLGTQSGLKFSFDEMMSWNYAKSPYFKETFQFYKKVECILGKVPTKIDTPLIWKFPFTFVDHKAPLNLDQLFTRFVGYLLDFIEEYLYDDPEFFLIIFSALKDKDVDHSKKTITNINTLPLKKNITALGDIRRVFKSSVLPLSLNEGDYGRRCYSTRTYIDEENNLKRVVTDISPEKTKKDVYILEGNKLVDSFIDEKIDNSTFSRYSSKTKTTMTIRNNKVIKSSINIKLPVIKYEPSKKKTQNSFNKHIGSFDLETYSNNGKIEVYAAGFSYAGNNIMISLPTTKTYYLDKGKSSDEVVLECINEMLATKYHNAIFYTHNLGGYDVIFLLKILADYNKKIGVEYYKLQAVLRENRILKLKVTVKKSKAVTNSIFLVDSLTLLPTNLESLAKGFSTKYTKPFFPYSFITEKTLYYIGNTPSIEYFNSVKREITQGEYDKLYSLNWNVREQTLKYLESDLISLLQIMYEFSSNIFDSHHVQVTDCLTITSLAVNIFMKNYYHKKGKYLALVKKPNIYEDLKQGYYGGLSEVYKGYGENLYYYDVNSLYPYAALQDMPGNLCEYIESYDNEGLDITNLFGYFYCEVKTTSDYLGYLPVRVNGLLTYPIGEFSGWFFSPHIEFAIKRGYKIKILKGYSFNRVSDVFKDYVLTLYKEKSEAEGAKRLIAKFLLNALLGRFGMHIDKKNTTLVNNQSEYEDIVTKYQVFDEKRISENLSLITHGSEIIKSICEQHGIDYIEVMNKKKGRSGIQEEFNKVRNVSVGVSAAVTSYSSIYMLKVKDYILSKGGEIYYTDTDSIVSNIQLPSKYSGAELGKFKLEYKILRGYFISSKLYCLIIRDGKTGGEKVVIKGKGVCAYKLTEKDFIDMLGNKTVDHGVKTSSHKNYTEGSVTIETKENIHLNPSSYRKRIKIYDEAGNWVDTRPLVLSRSEN